MDPAFTLLVLVVIVALVFDYINGFHDTANAIATVVSTNVLPMRSAIMLAAILNFVGALTGTAVASTIGKGLVHAEAVTQLVVLCALLGAIIWNLITWYYGIPSSSSHALVGGLMGAAIASSGVSAVYGEGLVKVVKSLIFSPMIGFVIALLVMIAIFWLCRNAHPTRLGHRFKRLQLLSAGMMALSHGSNDAQKTMGIITMSLVAHGAIVAEAGKFPVPTWVVWSCALAMALGTAAGGRRIIKTMGTKIIDLRPVHGFAAESAAAVTILTASHFGMPVSTTHVISGCIMGAGASQRVSAVRWGVTTRIIWAWVLTIPISAMVAAGLYEICALL